MLKKSILCFLLLSMSIFVHAQEQWFLQKINDKVSINFPAEPKKINEQNIGINKDDVIYLVTFIDLLKATGMTLEDFNSKIGAQEFADEFMSGLTPTMPKFKFGSAKINNVKGYTAYLVQGRDEETKKAVHMNIVFIDGTAYSITSIIEDGKDPRNKDKFLNEIYINGK
jgi:hypothetical protein